MTVRYDARVLTPRPWTLLQSSWAVELSATATPGPILELCAGAGQIGLAAAVLTGRALVQVDADPVAAEFARANAAAAGCADRVEVRVGPMDAVLVAQERFPIIVADPPYLPSDDIARWPDDPPAAIDGGRDGLDLLRVCLHLAARHLTPGGALLLQVAGEEQARAVATLSLDHQLGCREIRRHDPVRAVMLLT